MIMKFSNFYFLFLSFLILSTPLYAGTEVLTTYYPSPSGNYNKITTNVMQMGSSTLSAIQAEYKCSYDPSSGLPPCPAGIMYYDTDAKSLFFSDGTHWKMVVSSCVPLTPCSASLNCGTDSCGAQSSCSSITSGTPGSCS
jgi:hypothetical protein